MYGTHSMCIRRNGFLCLMPGVKPKNGLCFLILKDCHRNKTNVACIIEFRLGCANGYI